jgi:hypothetical protein
MNLRTDIDKVKVTKGTPKVYADNDTTSGKTVHRSFCGDCGSALWSNPDSVPGRSVVKVGVLDDAEQFKLTGQVNDQRKLNYTIR